MPAKLKCQSSDIVTVNQFEVATREYLKYNKKTEEVKTKTIKSYRSCIFTHDLPRTAQKICRYIKQLYNTKVPCIQQ